jgi:DNA polymerase III epsilon subunit-like protein|tara:strand:+ start:202 stop:765 length:564 start_codon:yes stop_codon:yes gene_type:complete
MSKNTDYTNIIFLDCESVSIQDDRDYFNDKTLQDDLIQLAFIDLNANEFELMTKPNEKYWNTKNWYGDKFSWETQKNYQELNAHAKDLIDLLNGKTIVVHNVEFDKNLIEKSLQHYGYELPNNINWICTKDIYHNRFGISNRKYSSLRRLTKAMGLYRSEEHHNALADCYMLRDLFNSYLRKNYLEV